MLKKLLIIEDEVIMLDLFKIHLKNQYDLTLVEDGARALEVIQNNTFDCIILDIMLPYIDGWSICKIIREQSITPILMLTARSEIEDRVRGLELGADDYLTKPFDFEELKARISALLRRSEYQDQNLQNNILSFNNGLLRIHKDSRKVYFDNNRIDLTSKEFQLLCVMGESPSRVFTRDELLDFIGDLHDSSKLRSVDSHIKNIRIKFRQVQTGVKIIKTVWGLGYQIILPGVE
ncbi:response regulator transcription factor [Lysinibacillus sp. 54212]|uniref:response regulator transcription factor n=1 Tax=Lysinibacillus sp. 54212 TaxID=3119829 RepID=UPI002FC7F5D7